MPFCEEKSGRFLKEIKTCSFLFSARMSVCCMRIRTFVTAYCFNRYFLLSGGEITQSVERATPGEDVLCSIPAVAARSQPVGSVSG